MKQWISMAGVAVVAVAVLAVVATGKEKADTDQDQAGDKKGEKELKWYTGAEFEEALQRAKEEDKKVFMDFTGSDWCPPCIQFKKRVLDKDEFAEYARENLVLVKLDFPRNKPLPAEVKKANQRLNQKFQVRGLPTLVLLNSEGVELDRDVGYRGEDAEAFVSKLQEWAEKEPQEA